MPVSQPQDVGRSWEMVQIEVCPYAYYIFKLRRGSYRDRLVGWSVGLWVRLQHKIRTKIQSERNAVEHQLEN